MGLLPTLGRRGSRTDSQGEGRSSLMMMMMTMTTRMMMMTMIMMTMMIMMMIMLMMTNDGLCTRIDIGDLPVSDYFDNFGLDGCVEHYMVFLTMSVIFN